MCHIDIIQISMATWKYLDWIVNYKKYSSQYN